MKVALGSLLFATIASLLSADAGAATDAEVERQLIAMTREANRQLPSGNSAAMVLGVFAGPGRQFTYLSVQAIPAADWSQSMRAHSRRIAINDYCSNPGMQWFRLNRVVVSWQASDQEGVHVYTNTVSPSNCSR